MALRDWGAQYGKGEGMAGRSYAIPTKDEQLNVLRLQTIQNSVGRFKDFARANPDIQFLVTRIGCGLAGFQDSEIAPMFLGSPSNCWLSTLWLPWLEPGTQTWTDL